MPVAKDLGAYLEYYKDYFDVPVKKIESLTCSDFLNLALQIEQRFCDRLLQPDPPHPHVEIHTITSPASNETFFWMIRRAGIGKEMVFAYPKFEGGKTGHAFFTQEPKLLELFYSHFDDLWKSTSTKQLLHGTSLFPNGYKSPLPENTEGNKQTGDVKTGSTLAISKGVAGGGSGGPTQ